MNTMSFCAPHHQLFAIVVWAVWMTGGIGRAAIISEDIERLVHAPKAFAQPGNKTFPNGYEVVPTPDTATKAIKQMPAGEAMVAAYLDVDGRRYYMTDWSYERHQRGESCNWIRPLGAGQGGGASSGGGGGSGGYRITGLPAGETLNIRTGPGTNFPVAAELPNGKDGIQITGDKVMNGEAEWVPVSFDRGKGWLRRSYLVRNSGTASESKIIVEKVERPKAEEMDDAQQVIMTTGKFEPRFDVTEFTVKAGSTVRLTLAVPADAIHPSNLVIAQFGKDKVLDKASSDMMYDPKSLGKGYIPDDKTIIVAHTKLLQPGEKDTIEFVAPKVTGAYAYCCTFPGHHAIQRGKMIVVE